MTDTDTQVATESPRSGAALQLQALVKTYGSRPVVDQIDLDIAPGEFLTLLGPSGSGKTTTLNMIAGFCEVTSGDISMDGQPIARRRPHQRNIGVVFQHYALFPHMTVVDNVAYPLRQRRIKRKEARARAVEALEMVNLDGFADRYPRQLSGGQQQRVALARALVFRPRVLLMDEPLGALDKKLRESMQKEIKRVHREVGITFVYVTHDQEEALALSDRIAIFNGGVIEQVGTAADLYDRPRSAFVADFIGESNQIDGVHAHEDGQPVVVRGATSYPAPASDFADGSRVVLMVRPEQLRIVENQDGGALGSIPAQVVDVFDSGWSRRVEVRTDQGDLLTCRELAGQNTPVGIGADVHLRYDRAHTVLLPPRDH